MERIPEDFRTIDRDEENLEAWLAHPERRDAMDTLDHVEVSRVSETEAVSAVGRWRGLWQRFLSR